MIPIAESLAEQLGQLALESIVVSIGVAACFSLTLLGMIRAGEARRGGSTLRSVPWASLAAISLVAFFALVALGVIVVVNK